MALLAAAAAGCATDAPPDDAAGSAAAAATRQRLEQLLSADNGLEVLRWSVSDNPRRIGTALLEYTDGPVLGPEQTETLRRNGLRFVLVPIERMTPLLGELGVAPQTVGVWYGQVLEWQQVHERPIGGEGVVLALHGRARGLEPGRLRLMVRAWTIGMEDGPYLYLELVPELVAPSAPSLPRTLDRAGLQGELLADLSIQVRLRPGYACVLTGESPAVEWQASASPESPGEQGRPLVVLPEDEPALGPAAETPDTLGQFLFAEKGQPPRRIMLVFAPRIPGRLKSPYERQPLAASE